MLGGSKEGLSGTLREGAEKAAGCDFFMVVLADLPLLTPMLMARMLMAPRDFPDAKIWRAVDSDGRPGHPIVFSKDILPEFAHLSGDAGAQSIVKKYHSDVVDIVLPGKAAVFDVDTPADAEKISSFKPKSYF